MKALLGAACVASVLLSGCVSNIASSLSESLSAGVLNHDDPPTIADGLPTFLIMLDGLAARNPENKDVLLAGSELYAAYAGSFVEDEMRQKKLAERAKDYGRRALCLQDAAFCAALDESYEDFNAALAVLNEPDLPWLYGYTSAWAGWVQANTSDYLAIADIPKIVAAMQRVIELDSSYRDGQPYIYLGVLATQIPPAAGGKPEEGRAYFEQAIALSDGQNLMAKALFAQFYARLVFDQELHDRLLNEVLDAPTQAPDLTLSNTLAKELAAELLAGSADYF